MQGEKQRTKQKRARQLASDPRADRGGAAAPPADVAADTNAAGSASNTLDSAPSADLPNRGSKRPARRKNTPSYQLDEVWEEESEEEEEEEEELDEGATLSCRKRPRGPVPVVIGIHAERWAYCNGNCQRQYQLLWSDDRAYQWSVADGSGGNDEYLRSHNLSAVKEQWRAEHPRENVKWFCTGKLGKRDKDKWMQHWKSKVMADPSW